MFAPPPAVTASVFARLPDEFRKSAPDSEWHRHQPGVLPAHSLLEGPAFDRDGNLYCVDIPWGRVFRVTPKGEFTLVAEYDGEPNGLTFHRDGRIFIADYKHGIVTLDPATGKVSPFVTRVRLERLKAVNDLTFASNGDIYFTDQGLTGWHDQTGRVFRVRASGEVDCLLDNVPSPNGLVLDPSETVLYVAVTRANAIWRVPLMKDGSVAWKADEMAANGKDKGCFSLDLAKMPAAIKSLMTEVAQIKGQGNKARAEVLIKAHVGAPGEKKPLHEVITERITRAPKASFVYSVKLD